MDFLEEQPTPDWLVQLTADSMINEAVPVNSILEGSFYYPCCAFDGRPVRYLARYMHSFIYVDYGESRNSLMQEINSETGGFRGYEILGQRDVSESELVPDGWRPDVMPSGRGFPTRPISGNRPFCLWFVFQRSEQFDELHGPERFSLLYLCADGAAAYQALFRKVTPRAIAIIQPGHGFGGNYTDFCNPDGLFARSVRAAGKALPELLLSGGMGNRNDYMEPIWLDDYNVDRGWISDQVIHAWGRNP